jgi:NitT/TauT family transport system permease protein
MIVILLTAIEYLLILIKTPEYILPRPTVIFKTIIENFNYLIDNTKVTVIESLLGFVLGNSIAYLFAILLILVPKVEKPGLNIAIFVKSTPVIALAPLFIIWFGNGIFGKVLMSALVCFFPMLVNSLTGLKEVDNNILDYLKSLSLKKIQIIYLLRIPSSTPYIFAALKTSSTISIVGAIIAEFSGSDLGIGHILQVSIYQIETAMMFSSIILISLFGLMFYWFIDYLERRLIRYKLII